ncbi:prephenate dehydratase domain-containing protein [Oscillatoria amoena NRMC-F 0135]|nr:prephenate dehydratase domain-containing protein [Oscillatoria amoena NRMC-F 0135]
MKITFFGEEGSFSQIAARRRFPKAQMVSGRTASECFEALRLGCADLIVVPIENASGGMIDLTVDEMIRFPKWGAKTAAVREELLMRIELLLMGRSKLPLKNIRKIYSHRAAFDHCHTWLQKHLPKAERVVCASTSVAAQRALEDPQGAAIASIEAARLYRLKIITREVGKNAVNQTKFFVVGKPVASREQPRLATVFFETPDKPGALCDVLTVLKNERVNMTRIYSRPIFNRLDEYIFMAELAVSPGPESLRKLLGKLKPVTDVLYSVGHYPLVKV